MIALNIDLEIWPTPPLFLHRGFLFFLFLWGGIITPNLWLLNISDLVLLITESWQWQLSEWVCQNPVRDGHKLRQRLIDRQTVIDQAIDRW